MYRYADKSTYTISVPLSYANGRMKIIANFFQIRRKNSKMLFLRAKCTPIAHTNSLTLTYVRIEIPCRNEISTKWMIRIEGRKVILPGSDLRGNTTYYEIIAI